MLLVTIISALSRPGEARRYKFLLSSNFARRYLRGPFNGCPCAPRPHLMAFITVLRHLLSIPVLRFYLRALVWSSLIPAHPLRYRWLCTQPALQ